MPERSEGTERFHCPYCQKHQESFEALKNHVLTEHRMETVPEPEGLIRLTVNGEVRSIRVEAEWTLYQVIHDRLGLTGAKMFCDRGACGSCTVIMNGRAVLSCMTLAIECDGAIIKTVEGVAAEHPGLIEKYAEHHAMQCGYCTPGFVVTAKALLDKNENPSEREIREALAGNLCRCGTYPQHPIAVLDFVRQQKTAGSTDLGSENQEGKNR
ncbi:MAG: (2Fe-2S)-binding protein [Thermodesulfobacteriota bacterium]